MASHVGAAAVESLTGIAIGTRAMHAVGNGDGSPGLTVSDDKPIKFLNFASWFNTHGRDYMKESSKEVYHLDPDIAGMRLPLNTKMIWQRERNFKAQMVQQEKHFWRQVRRKGGFEWWD